MPFYISFEVEGLPPRKDGGHSMWNKDKEAMKLIALRSQIHKFLLEHKISTPINEYLRLKICINLSEKDLERSDIDNLVGGVFDGLLRASKSAKLNNEYKQYEGTPIHPLNSFLFDDSRILELNVKKKINENRTFYQVTMESLDLNEIRVETYE